MTEDLPTIRERINTLTHRQWWLWQLQWWCRE